MTIYRRGEGEARPMVADNAGRSPEPANGLPAAPAESSSDDGAASAPPASPAPAPPRLSASQPGPASDGTVLAPGTVLAGTLRAQEPVRIAGTLEGTLEAEGVVVVESGGRLVARVVAPEITVAGFLDGQIQCQGRLDVRASGLVKGTVRVGTLRIEEGALLDGRLQMQGAITTASLEPIVDPELPAEPTSQARGKGPGDTPQAVRPAPPGQAPRS